MEESIQFFANYASGILSIQNPGNVPVYSFKVETRGFGSFETFDLSDLDSSWPAVGLKQGGTYSSTDLSAEIGGAEEITLIPVLIGTSKGKQKTHICDERFGERVV